jgi:perosamine synthetase
MSETLAILGGPRAVPAGLTRGWPDIRDEDREAVLRVLARGTLGGATAPEGVALAEEFAAYLGEGPDGVPVHCLAVNSGTAALHCAVAAAGLQPGDEVITSALSFVATPLSALHHGAIPVFVDIDPRTFNLDPSQIESALTSRTRAIIPVHVHGLPADMAAINAIAASHDLVVIEDAAQAHGARYQGHRAGTWGHMAAFSLHYAKNLPAGEGGLFVTASEDVLARADRLRVFGERIEADAPRSYEALGMGWNYRIPELSAALARSQLARLDDYNGVSQRNAEYLTRALGEIPGLEPPLVPADRTHVYHKYRVMLRPDALGIDVLGAQFRDRVLVALQAEGVAVSLWQTVPLPGQPLFQRKEGLGGGYPWCLTAHGRRITYRAEDYPETVRVLDSSLIMGSDAHPLYAQDAALMAYYVRAFDKVLRQAEGLLRSPEPTPRGAGAGAQA